VRVSARAGRDAAAGGGFRRLNAFEVAAAFQPFANTVRRIPDQVMKNYRDAAAKKRN
jgi:hypothetical protein